MDLASANQLLITVTLNMALQHSDNYYELPSRTMIHWGLFLFLCEWQS